MGTENTFNENLMQAMKHDKFSVLWFTNHDTGETYKIFASGKVEWSKKSKKGFTVSNKIHALFMLGYSQGYNAAKSDFERTGTISSTGLQQGRPPNSEISCAAISEAIALTSATSDKSYDAVVAGRTQAVAQVAPLVKEFRERAKSIMDNPFIGNRVAEAWDESADQLEIALRSIEDMT